MLRQTARKMRIELVNAGFYHNEKEVFSNLNLSFKGGDLAVITGDESSGKSALFDLLRLKKRPFFGNVLIDGKDPFENNKIRKMYRSYLGIVPEPGTYSLDIPLKKLIKANREVSLRLKRGEYLTRMEEGRKFFRLSFDDDGVLGQLSRSERIRFLLLLEMIRDPAVLLFDSVLSEAGDTWGEKIFLFSRKICEDGRIIVMLERKLPLYLEKRATKLIEESGQFKLHTFYRKEEVTI
ncbi:MAG: ATP-binding cassette domain-containing protein [Deltaproteobacteria bacterium]|nr:ATP-binding cassette domain-containing protein [Deltaproteobacteria bacterium]